MVFTKKVLFIALLLLVFACEQAVNEPIKAKVNKKQLKALMNQGLDAFDVGEYDEAERIFNRLDTLITVQSDTIIQIHHLFNKSELLKTRADYSKSITNYYKALKLAQGIRDERLIGKAYYNITTVYLYREKVANAQKFLAKAIHHFRKAKSEKDLINCDVLNASIQSYYKKFNASHVYLDRIIAYATKSKDNDLLSIAYNNKANIYTTTKEFGKGIELYGRALSISKDRDDLNSISIYWGNIGKNYLDLNELESAELYIDSSLRLAKKLGAKETELINYERLTDLEKKKSNFKKALEYSHKTNQVIAQINQIQAKNDYQQAEKQFQSELEAIESRNSIKLLNKDKLIAQSSLTTTRIILYFVLIFILLFVAAAVVFYRKRREITAAKSKLLEVETKRLADELEFKRKELISFSLSLTEREKFIQEMKEHINKLGTSQPYAATDLSSLKRLLLSFHADGDADLHAKIEELNASFHYNLKTNFPQLTDEDIRLASLIVLGTPSKDIATILSIETKSVNMKRYRLKKKLNLEQDADLASYLKQV